jgi:glycosyltransferase involved in cell wall biosynthesis
VADGLYRLAVVTPWFGADLTGGAERLAWQAAHGLAERGHTVEVFTTCARSFASDWGVDAHPAGARAEDGVLVRRFPVDPRAANAFDRANEILLGRPLAYYRERTAAIEPDVASDFIRSGINSAAALDALRAELERFDAVLVMPYPYGLALSALDVAGPRAMLQPCLHDEPYAYLPEVENAFRNAGALLFNSPAERSLAYRLYGPAIALKSVVVGHWIDAKPPVLPLPQRVRSFRPADHRYVLYLGRRDATKNVDLLVESFARFRRHCRMLTLELVLIGPGSRSFEDPRHGIRDLGLVDEAQKAALLSNALAVVQPSINESFSRAVMEGWSAGKPVAVNGRCAVTGDAVRESGGGWLATTKAEWSALFEEIDGMPQVHREEAGERGRRFFVEQTSRERILDRYEGAIHAFAAAGRHATGFDVPAAPAVVRRLSDGRRTILYAGPLTETSCIEQLLAGFAFLLSLGVDARLVLAGEFDPDEGLADRFYDLVAQTQLTERVVVLDRSRQDVVSACFRSAGLFWSASQDGPSRELVDAMGFGVPVFAFGNPVSRRVLGDAGILFSDKRDPRALAGVAAMILTDRSLRDTLLEGQRRRFEALRSDGELERAG